MSSCSEKRFISAVISEFTKSLGVSLLKEEFIYEALKGGGSAATLYRIDLDENSYVLRFLPSQADSITRMHQIMLAKQAGKMGIGPKVYFIDSQMKAIVMEFISGRTVQESDFEDSSCLIEFAKFLQRLHQSKDYFPLATSPFKRFRDFYLKAEKKSYIPPRFAEAKALMEELEATFQLFSITQVPSHLDLHPLNIMLLNKRFFLVDWVNGGVSDPYFDLATFSIFLGLNETQFLTFLMHYLGREPTDHELNRLIIAQPIRLFVIAAALFSSDNSTLSYEEIMRGISLPTLSDFGKKGAIWPHSHLGVSMFQTALEIVDQDRFKSALENLKNHAFSMV